MARRGSWSKRSSSGMSTLHAKDAAAREIADRVVRWFRGLEGAKSDKARQAALADLGHDLERLAPKYLAATRTHESLSVDSLATADAAGLLERINVARFSKKADRVYKAAQEFLARPYERVRRGKHGAVYLDLIGDQLYAHDNGRVDSAYIETMLAAERLPASAFEAFIGPEVPPPSDDEGPCHCSRDERWCDLYPEPCAGGLPLDRCPNAHPCGGGCGRAVTTHTSNWCRFCKWSCWTAPPWRGVGPGGRSRPERDERRYAWERPIACPDCGAGLPADGSCCDACGWARDERWPRKPSGRSMAEIDREKRRRGARQEASR